ncbi:MAG: Coq4 family protein [Hydrococcus sp. Prado102]|jgi:ubiquinone biosynthesis protein Coq4|nr:Coq4 family protein [Hydrococcus sp. Prado102]
METIKDTQQQWQDLALESFLNIVKAPDGDFDAIARLSSTLNDASSLKIIVEFLSRHPQGKQAFLERPRLGNVDLQQLHQLPQDTLGYVYADNMLKNGLTPLQANSINNDYEYLSAHITETHDLWHIVTGCDTNILGEIQLEAFYVAQLYASRFWLALLAKNLLKAVVYDIEVAERYMNAITQGWTMAKQAKPLFGIRWNTLWEKPLKDVRSSLNIIL